MALEVGVLWFAYRAFEMCESEVEKARVEILTGSLKFSSLQVQVSILSNDQDESSFDMKKLQLCGGFLRGTDFFVSDAIVRVLTPLLDSHFLDSSFAFRLSCSLFDFLNKIENNGNKARKVDHIDMFLSLGVINREKLIEKLKPYLEKDIGMNPILDSFFRIPLWIHIMGKQSLL